MYKIIWLLILLISLIVSVVINFNAKSIATFVSRSIIIALIIVVIITLIIYSIKNIIEKNTKKAILFGVFSIITTILLLSYLTSLNSGPLFDCRPPPTFKTNILTAECTFKQGAFPGCATADPWYIKDGCDLSQEEKLNIFIETRWYNQSINECNMRCEMNMSDMFCSYNIGRNISCKNLTPCSSISCN